MRVRASVVSLSLSLILLLSGAVFAGQLTVTAPSNFDDTLVASVSEPTSLAFTPDGRMLITTRLGTLRTYQNGKLQPNLALDLRNVVCGNDNERGLLGLAIDPQFAANKFIYLYYTSKKGADCTTQKPVNRLSRFTLSDTDPAATLASEWVLINNIPSINGNHNSGDIHIGKDGYLYVSVGDGGCDYAAPSKCAAVNDSARDLNALVGKVLRITRDGGIPPENPYVGADSVRCNETGTTAPGKKCQEIFASGLRNPFRMAFDPDAPNTRFFIHDVGQELWEEINEGKIGADYGWNVREGPCANSSDTDCGPLPAGLTNPIYSYKHGDAPNSCTSVTGGAFVPNGVWPSEYDNVYLYGDYSCGKIFKLTESGGKYTAEEMVAELGASSVVHMVFGPYVDPQGQTTQALYYTSRANAGQIRRLAYNSSGNRSPSASLIPTPKEVEGSIDGPAPLQVRFSANGSIDPDEGDTPLLQYSWDFGNGVTSTKQNPEPQMYAAGVYTATLTVSDGKGGTDTKTIMIDSGNVRPAPKIDVPSAGQPFRVGEEITLNGSATDPDGNPVTLTWEVILHHDDHTHPFLAPTVGNSVTIKGPAPEDLNATNTSYLEIRLTADDGRSKKTLVQNMQPRKVPVTFATDPPGLQLQVNNNTLTGPANLTSWENYTLNVVAPLQATNDGWMAFKGWTDGVTDASRVINTPASGGAYTAQFGKANLVMLPLVQR